MTSNAKLKLDYTLGEPNPDSHSTKRVRIGLSQSVAKLQKNRLVETKTASQPFVNGKNPVQEIVRFYKGK